MIAPLADAVAPARPAQVLDLSVTNGSRPFAGDRRLLTTVSPNGDGFRDTAIVRFRLTHPATVRMSAVATQMVRAGRTETATIWTTTRTLPAGRNQLVWRPARATEPRTYILRLAVAGGRTYGAYGPAEAQNAPVVRIQGIDAAFTRRSYAPGETAELRLATDARFLRLQVFAYQSPGRPSEQDVKTSGLAMTGPIPVDWRAHADAPALLRVVRAGDWPSGLYFVRATSSDGRVGYAPFIVRPRRLGQSRVAVVLATNTWAAYNFEDADGDGWGDSWYVTGRHRAVDLARPFLDFGVPFRFHDWDLEFVAWLNQTHKRVDFLSDDDLDRMTSGASWHARYDLVVFPGHEEYVTGHEYDVIRALPRPSAATSRFSQRTTSIWPRDAARSRCSCADRCGASSAVPSPPLVGVQYVGSNHGARQAGFRRHRRLDRAVGVRRYRPRERRHVRPVRDRDRRARRPQSPRGTQCSRRSRTSSARGRTAQMTYYETPRGAKVFAAGAMNFTASLGRPDVARLVENLWSRLSVP